MSAIAPHSRILQDQILATLENLESVLPPFSYVVLKGKQNYISLKALKGELDWLAQDPPAADTPAAGHGLSEGRVDHGMAVALAILCGWVAQTPSGDWADLRTSAVEQPIEAAAGPAGGYALEAPCHHPAGSGLRPVGCLDFYRQALARLKTAQVAVLNHALLASGPELAAGRFNLIVDEAHNLEDSATSAVTEEVGVEHVECSATLSGISGSAAGSSPGRSGDECSSQRRTRPPCQRSC